MKQEEMALLLSAAEKKQLRALGHRLSPIVYIGKENMTNAVIASAKAALAAHELIKVKLGQNTTLSREEAAQSLLRLTGSALVQQIGKIILLYRPNPELNDKKRIHL